MSDSNVFLVDVDQLHSLLSTNKDLCLIDVRENSEYITAHIKEAIHIPKAELPAKIEQIVSDKNQAIYLHCHAGVRSLQAAEQLLAMGYQSVYSVSGGIAAWADKGYPVNTGK